MRGDFIPGDCDLDVTGSGDFPGDLDCKGSEHSDDFIADLDGEGSDTGFIGLGSVPTTERHVSAPSSTSTMIKIIVYISHTEEARRENQK